MTSVKSLRINFLILLGLVLVVGSTVEADWRFAKAWLHDQLMEETTP